VGDDADDDAGDDAAAAAASVAASVAAMGLGSGGRRDADGAVGAALAVGAARRGGGGGGGGSDDSDAGGRARRPNKTELRRAARAAARAPPGAPRIAAPVDPDVALRRLDPEKIRGGARGLPLAAFIASHDGLSLARGAAARLEAVVGAFVCAVCGDVAPSRNALFLHIKTTGHAAAAGGDDAPSRGKAKRAAKKLRKVPGADSGEDDGGDADF
jgi:hypothetical protein